MKNQPHKTRILLVDDHALLRRGLADLLRYESDLAVVGEAGDGEVAVDAAMKDEARRSRRTGSATRR